MGSQSNQSIGGKRQARGEEMRIAGKRSGRFAMALGAKNNC